jgi:hypothetical protein
VSHFLPEPKLEQLSKLLPPPSQDPEKMDTEQDPEDYLEAELEDIDPETENRRRRMSGHGGGYSDRTRIRMEGGGPGVSCQTQ